MSDELRELLTAAAPAPTSRVDPQALHERRVRRDRLRWAGGVTALALVGAVAVTLPQPGGPVVPFIDQPQHDQVPTDADAPGPDDGDDGVDAGVGDATDGQVGERNFVEVDWPEGPSQDARAADDQQVPEAVAAMSLGERLTVVHSVATEEGLWVASRLRCCDDGEPEVSPDSSGREIPLWQYQEILLLDPATLTVRRAWPMAWLPHGTEGFTVTDTAVYATRGGDGGDPDSYVLRIDRGTLEARVRISAHDTASADEFTYPPYDWVTVSEADEPGFYGLVWTADGSLLTIGARVTEIDPVTLEPGASVPAPIGTSTRTLFGRYVRGTDGTTLVDPWTSEVVAEPFPRIGRVGDTLGADAHGRNHAVLIRAEGSNLVTLDASFTVEEVLPATWPVEPQLHAVDGLVLATVGNELWAVATAGLTRLAVADGVSDQSASAVAVAGEDVVWIAGSRVWRLWYDPPDDALATDEPA